MGTLYCQKQPPRGIPRKRCSENMQQIYRRTPMPQCNFNKIAKQLYWNRTSPWVLSCKFAAFFRTLFPRNTSGWLLSFADVFFENFSNFFPQRRINNPVKHPKCNVLRKACVLNQVFSKICLWTNSVALRS